MFVPVHDYKNNFRGTTFHVVGSDGIGVWFTDGSAFGTNRLKQIKKKKKDKNKWRKREK